MGKAFRPCPFFYSRNSFREPAGLLERVLQHDGVLPVRAYGDYHGLDAGELLEPPYIGLGLCGKLGELRDALRGGVPAIELLVYRFAPGEDACLCGEVVDLRALESIPGADLYLRELVEHVELCDHQAVEPVHARGVPEGYGVKPAASPRPAGRGAVLAALLAAPVRLLALELGRGRAFSDPRAVGLCYADYLVYPGRADAAPGGGAAGHRVARGDIGGRGMVYVEERPLRALAEDLLSL